MALGFASPRRQEPPDYSQRQRVLLVEPDGRDRQYYCSVLEREGFEVCACASYSEGDRCLQNGPLDFVVINQGSRAFEGRSFLEQVLAIDRHIPVVVLTHSVDMPCYLEAMQLGAVDYLEKPLSSDEVIRVVETHLRPRVGCA